MRLLLPVVLRVAGTRAPDAAIRSGIGAGLDAATIERLVEDVVAESPAILLGRASPIPNDITRGAVLTSDDRELSLALQQRTARSLGSSWERTIASGHLPMLEQPAALAIALREFASHVECAPRITDR